MESLPAVSTGFPTTNLYELESLIFTDCWPILYKREDSLRKCLISATQLAEEGGCCWIGCGLPMAPLPGPLCSSDLTTPAHFAVGYYQGKNGHLCCCTNKELHRAVEDAFDTIIPQIL